MKSFEFIWFKYFPIKLTSIRQGYISADTKKKAEKKLEKRFTHFYILYEVK